MRLVSAVASHMIGGTLKASVAAGEMFAKKPAKVRDLLGNVEPAKDGSVEIPAGGCAWLVAE